MAVHGIRDATASFAIEFAPVLYSAPMISLYDIQQSVNGQLFGEPSAQLFTDFCLDPRTATEGKLFVALRPDDGYVQQEIAEAIQNGVSGVICTRPPDCDTNGVSIIMVKNPLDALMEWSRFVIGKQGIKAIAVGGTSGKSTAVEAIAAVLGVRYRVLRGDVSSSGRLALPLTLAHLRPEHQFIVLKLDAAFPGEMGEMVQSVQPDVAVINHIECLHSASFESCEQLVDEQARMLDFLSPTSLAVLNYDDKLVLNLASRTRAMVTTISVDQFGADMMAYNVVNSTSHTGFDLRFGTERHVGRWTAFLGKMHLYSILAALAVARHYEVPIEAALQVLSELAPPAGHMRPLTGPDGCVVIDDSYDADPRSTMAALDWLEQARVPGQRVILVMGDLDELGANSVRAHRQIGHRAASAVDFLVTQGAEAALIGRAAIDQGFSTQRIRTTYSPQDAVAVLRSLGLQRDDLVLIKGGHQAQMEIVTQALVAGIESADHLVHRTVAFTVALGQRPLRPSWVEIDTETLAQNIRIIRQGLGSKVALMAVVKADAYGHGAVMAAHTALLNGADYLGVASIAEALELRAAGIDAPILVLSYLPPSAVRQAIRQNISIVLFDLETARAYDRMARDARSKLRVHVKIDTGMGRLGVLLSDALKFFRYAAALKHLEFEGIYTHFAMADSDAEYTQFQVEQFKNLLLPLRAGGYQFRYIHVANSAGMLRSTDYHFNMVRAGLILYGMQPSPELEMPQGIRPVMSWKTTVLQVRSLPSGYPIGYGNTYQTRSKERIAILPVGYADGLRRSPQTWRHVLVHGQRAPLVGRVSMEKIAVNVTHIPGVTVGDEVVLLGRQGDEMIRAEDVAEWLGTINYEVSTTILVRVPRR